MLHPMFTKRAIRRNPISPKPLAFSFCTFVAGEETLDHAEQNQEYPNREIADIAKTPKQSFELKRVCVSFVSVIGRQDQEDEKTHEVEPNSHQHDPGHPEHVLPLPVDQAVELECELHQLDEKEDPDA